MGLLFRFRENKILFTTDLCDMFHQVKIKIKDQNAQRFLWTETNRNRAPGVYVVTDMTFEDITNLCTVQ